MVLTKQSEQIRTNLYIARRVWGELKARAFQERTSTSKLIDFLARMYLKDRKVRGEVTLHRKHNETEDRKPRAVYFEPDLWEQLQTLSIAENFSIASLVESLIVAYLENQEEAGADAAADAVAEAEPTDDQLKELDPNRYVKVGNAIYDIGETPIIIDSTGQLHEKDKKEGES